MTKDELNTLLKIDQKQARVDEIQQEMSQPDFWTNPEKARVISQEMSDLNKIINEAKANRYILGKQQQAIEQLKIKCGY